jgi:hypothetical protein
MNFIPLTKNRLQTWHHRLLPSDRKRGKEKTLFYCSFSFFHLLIYKRYISMEMCLPYSASQGPLFPKLLIYLLGKGGMQKLEKLSHNLTTV